MVHPVPDAKRRQRQPCGKRNWSGPHIISGIWNTANKMKTATSANGPYDQKAAYSADMLELTKDYESIEQDIALTLEYAYGVPGDQELTYNAALTLAEQAVANKYGVSSSMTILCECFDILRKCIPETCGNLCSSIPMTSMEYVNASCWMGRMGISWKERNCHGRRD